MPKSSKTDILRKRRNLDTETNRRKSDINIRIVIYFQAKERGLEQTFAYSP